MNRDNWDVYFMKAAKHAATRSTCDRLNVGAVIVRDRVQISTGYNGSPKGYHHCSDFICDSCGTYFSSEQEYDIMSNKISGDVCSSRITGRRARPSLGMECFNSICLNGKLGPGHRLVSKFNDKGEKITDHCVLTVHAELNAIVNAASTGVSTRDAIIYVTHLPCWECAKCIVNAGITKVIYETTYKPSDNVKLLRYHIQDGIWRIDMETGNLVKE